MKHLIFFSCIFFSLLSCEDRNQIETVEESVLRKFIPDEHIKNVLTGELVELFDNKGNKLEGIRGRIGVAAPSKTGVEIGIDYMEMSPGSEFPLHTHEGDHILYVIEGKGIAHVDGKDYTLKKGDVIFVPSEYPHAFKTFTEYKNKFTFVAVGHPHKKLNAKDRMKLVEVKERKNHTHSH